jgi:hypothetical protein
MYNVFGSLTGHCKFDGSSVREIGEGSGFVEMYLFDGELIGRCKSNLKREKKEKLPHVDPKSINTTDKAKRATLTSTAKTTRARDVFDQDEPVKKENRKWRI